MSLSTEERFKRNFITLVEICEEMIQEGDDNGVCTITPTMFSIFKIVISKMNSRFLIERFIRKTSDYWGKIYEKDIEYFKSLGLELFNVADNNGLDNIMDREDKSLTAGLTISHVSSFKKLLSTTYEDSEGKTVNIFDDERVDDTWKIMHSFVKQSILFIHSNRTMVDGEYTKDYFSNINIKENAEKWKVKNIS
jgi:hypothetical protein